jgi:hypothetical protein
MTPAQAKLQSASALATGNWQLAVGRARRLPEWHSHPTRPQPHHVQTPTSRLHWQRATARGPGLVTPGMQHRPHSPTTSAQANLQLANPPATGNWQLAGAPASSIIEWRAHPTHPQLRHNPTSCPRIDWQLGPATGNWQPAVARDPSPRNATLTNATHPQHQHQPTSGSGTHRQLATGNWP